MVLQSINRVLSAHHAERGSLNACGVLVQLAIRGGGIDLDNHYGVPKEDLQTLNFQRGVFRRSRLWHMDLSHSSTPPEVQHCYRISSRHLRAPPLQQARTIHHFTLFCCVALHLHADAERAHILSDSLSNGSLRQLL